MGQIQRALKHIDYHDKTESWCEMLQNPGAPLCFCDNLEEWNAGNGRTFKREGTYVYWSLIHAVVWQKHNIVKQLPSNFKKNLREKNICTVEFWVSFWHPKQTSMRTQSAVWRVFTVKATASLCNCSYEKEIRKKMIGIQVYEASEFILWSLSNVTHSLRETIGKSQNPWAK